MKALARILATLTTILGGPLIWHAIMPESSHWMNRAQIAGTLPLFLIFAIGYTACWLSLNNKI
ncbi:MAG: hypothetical protein IKZ07_07230 [Akkermansia sp.]|nr:hypothetical protein [Akkermansia sp.]